MKMIHGTLYDDTLYDNSQTTAIISTNSHHRQDNQCNTCSDIQKERMTLTSDASFLQMKNVNKCCMSSETSYLILIIC